MRAAIFAAATVLMACSVDGLHADSTRAAWALPETPAGGTQVEGRRPSAIFLFSTARKGVIHTDLESAGATFVEAEYDTVLFNVGAVDRARLVAHATSELDASREVILDSNGSESEIQILFEVTQRLTGGGSPVAGVRIVKVQEGLMETTPIETEAEYRQRELVAGRRVSRGNTARHLFVMD